MTPEFARRVTRRIAVGLLTVMMGICACGVAAAQTPPVADPTPPTTHETPAAQPPAQVDGFVPASSLPPPDEVAPGPLVIGAYALAWVAILFYVWTLWARLTRVETEIADLARRVDTSLRPGGSRARS